MPQPDEAEAMLAHVNSSAAVTFNKQLRDEL